MTNGTATPTPPMAKSALPGFLWFGLLCVAVLFAPWLGGQFTGVGPAAARALVCAAGIAWVVDRWGAWTLPRPAAWLWLFTGWSALTALQGNNWHDSLMALSNLVSWATLATLAADASREWKRRDILIISGLTSLVAVGFQGAWDASHNVEGWRVFGPFTTPNLFASYLITLLPLALFVFWAREGDGMFTSMYRLLGSRPVESGGSTKPSAAAGVLIGLLMTGCIFCGTLALAATASKGALLAVVVALVLAHAVSRFRLIERWSGIAAMLAVIVLAVGIGGNTLFGRVGAAATGEAHSGHFRVLTWEASARMAADNPILGTGIGTFGSTFNRYAIAGWTEAAHNAYLQAAAETGFFGLVLFLAALGSAAVWLFRAARSEDRTLALLGAAGLAGLLAAAAHNLVDYGWTLWAPTAALWTLIGLGVGGLEAAGRPIKRIAAVAMLFPLAATVLGGILVANAASLADPATEPNTRMTPDERIAALRSARGLDPLDADLARRLAMAEAQNGQHNNAIRNLEDAVRLAPGEPTAWRQLGEAYRNTGQPDKARQAFARGLENAPKALRLLMEAADMAEATGHHDEALVYYGRIVQTWEGPAGRYPATPEIVPIESIRAYAALAQEADRMGLSERATALRKALIALAKRYEENRGKYALIWQATGQDDPDALAGVRAMKAEAERNLPGTSRAAD